MGLCHWAPRRIPDCSPTLLQADSPLVNWIGRVQKPGDGSVRYDWVGVGAQLAFSGSRLWANYTVTGLGSSIKTAVYQYNQNWYYPESIAWVNPASGNDALFLASQPSPVKLASNVPPQYFNKDASGGALEVVSFSTDGTFQAPPRFTRALEFVGDSITAATNVHANPPCGDGGLQSDYSASYSGLLCNFFGANCSTIAVGGKGLIRNCCDHGTTMPEYYMRTTYGSKTSDYDFAASGFVPDGVVINLGG